MLYYTTPYYTILYYAIISYTITGPAPGRDRLHTPVYWVPLLLTLLV